MSIKKFLYRILGESDESKEFRRTAMARIEELEKQLLQKDKPIESVICRESSPELQDETTTKIKDNRAIDTTAGQQQWFTLLEEICSEIERIREIRNDYTQPDKVYYILKSIDSSLRDAMVYSGAKRIAGDEKFDVLRHDAINDYGQAHDGCAVSKVVETGIFVGDRVFLRALVEVNNK